jgi:hypothetical protein
VLAWSRWLAPMWAERYPNVCREPLRAAVSYSMPGTPSSGSADRGPEAAYWSRRKAQRACDWLLGHETEPAAGHAPPARKES